MHCGYYSRIFLRSFDSISGHRTFVVGMLRQVSTVFPHTPPDCIDLPTHQSLVYFNRYLKYFDVNVHTIKDLYVNITSLLHHLRSEQRAR